MNHMKFFLLHTRLLDTVLKILSQKEAVSQRKIGYCSSGGEEEEALDTSGVRYLKLAKLK